MQLHYHPGMNQKEPIVSAESTLTDRYQTTIPEVVRKALRLGKRDKLEFLLDDSGEIRIRKSQKSADAEHSDPALAGFLELLAKDVEQNPTRLRELDDAYFARIAKILDGLPPLPEYDPNEPLARADGDTDEDWLYAERNK